MRKQTKLVAVLSAAALLAMGASMTSFAAGWEKDDAGIWHYYDSDDEMVYDEWQKDGSKWFYLDEDGNMLTDAWVDDAYYVGEDGAMLVNEWKKTYSDNDMDDPDEDGEFWYYFGSKGKKIEDDSKKINGKTYYFDEEGRMLSGWQQFGNYAYYLGGEDEGWRAENQWLWLEKSGLIDNDDEDDEVFGTDVLTCNDNDGEQCDDEGWYWFQSSGKLYTDSSKKKINGKYYIFNEHGQMLYEWIDNDTTLKVGSNAQLDGQLASSSYVKPTAKDILYYNEVDDGSRGNGWYEIDGAQDMDTDNDTDWYYIDDGEVLFADNANKDYATVNSDGDMVYVQRIKVEGKYFSFNEKGQMQTGLQFCRDAGGFYYFDDNGYQKTGRVSNVECDDDDYNFYFNTKNGKNGLGYTGKKDGYLYFNGKRLEADDDYRIYYVNGDLYLVNTKGKIQNAKSGKDFVVENDTLKDCATFDDDGEVEVVTTGDTIKTVAGVTAETLIDKLEAALANDTAKVADYKDAIAEDSLPVTVPSIELYDDMYTYSIKNGAIEKTPDWLKVNPQK